MFNPFRTKAVVESDVNLAARLKQVADIWNQTSRDETEEVIKKHLSYIESQATQGKYDWTIPDSYLKFCNKKSVTEFFRARGFRVNTTSYGSIEIRWDNI